MIPHLKERRMFLDDAERLGSIEEAGKLWESRGVGAKEWHPIAYEPMWFDACVYRRRPKMLHVIDARGVRHEFLAPMREAPIDGERYWLANIYAGIASRDKWTGGVIDQSRLAFGLCQSTEEGAQQQLAALRAVCLGGDV